MTNKGWLALTLTIVSTLYFSCARNPAGSEERDSKPKDEVALDKGKHSEGEHAEQGQVTIAKEVFEKSNIRVEEAAPRSLKRELRLSGAIQVSENRLAHVSSRIPGRLSEVTAGLGDRVGKGSRLAMIDSPELGQAQSAYLMARAKRLVAEKGYERAKTLVEAKVIGIGELQRREGEYLSVQAEAQAAEDRLRLLGITDQEIVALERDKSVRSQAPILSPLAGTVIERNVTVGEVVEPAKSLFTVADLSVLWGIADLQERDLARIRKGAEAEISVASYPEERFKGKVTYLSDTIDPATRTLKVRIEVENPKGQLKPQMFATFRILTEEAGRSLAIPASAVQREGAQAIVFVEKEETEKEKRFEKRPVSLGPEVQGYYPVLSGLQPGEKVVTTGAFVLKSETLKGLMEE
ncbi:MAG: efflux RND transporter periplasmic adaptor subunit [Candidatus Manganitrophaceae bacterium]|nr:MAG: efflux RND transporter periplasmic adaptor subunit [Candidatus Manganitrophaceae bacterium]